MVTWRGSSAPTEEDSQQRLPCSQGPQAIDVQQEETSDMTTVLLRGLPSEYRTPELVNLLDAQGFAGKYSFAYAPVDFTNGAGLGYAVVCLTACPIAEDLIATMQNFQRWSVLSSITCTASWNDHQGMSVLIERYRNSPVMHKKVPHAYKPAVFEGGARVSFP